MGDELQKHKTSDTIKWVLTLCAFILVFTLLSGIMLGWFDKKDNSEKTETEQATIIDGCGNAMSEGNVYEMPKTIAFTAKALAASSQRSAAVKIEAYVYPESAVNKKVDYSVAWGNAPSHGKEQVSNYLTVTPDSDGSTLATVTCKKGFGNDKIIITVTTRDGGYTATCTVSFIGTASGISITSSNAALTNTSGRGNYYSLGTNKTYTFDIKLSNDFDSVGAKNLSVSLGGVGSLSFGRMYENDGGYPNYSEVTKKNMSDIVSWFITSATISGNTVTVKTGNKDLFNYYSSYGPDEYYIVTYYYDKLVVELDDYLNYKTDPSGSFRNSTAKENMQLMPSCYFTLTVIDSVGGVSETIKLWLDGVNGVSLNNSELSF